jgi:transposase
MHVLHPVWCGIDVHAAQLTACLRRVSDDGQITTALVECGTTYRALIALRTWWQAQPCPVVGIESTGVSWKPVSHVLREAMEVCVANSQDVRQRSGKKTDERDATWIAELLAHRLIKPSFVPPPEIRALRDLTRTRVSLVQTRTQAKNRVYKILEDTNIKLASVVSDVCGESARRVVEALVAGERDAAKLSAMALGSLRGKIPQLEVALEGQFTAHHAKLIAGTLEDEVDANLCHRPSRRLRAARPA